MQILVFDLVILNLKAPKHTLPPQTPTRTALAHSTRTKSTDPVYGSNGTWDKATGSVLFVRVLCASSVRVGVCGVCVCLGALAYVGTKAQSTTPYHPPPPGPAIWPPGSLSLVCCVSGADGVNRPAPLAQPGWLV